ncbi:dnaJ homolog subfamily C member 10-like [Neocloeon triangulifer]|uniref:dnaJ homolog subfamily C member 10-like n=1 Tax=Neocloeon triangulifer TaxID=2078957 RepID=UPI00286F1DEB|nr:dnaJ homolog subfamily C member 10-like [Neocloeon triangulifer]
MTKYLLFLILLATPTTFCNEDYYELLGVNKDADNREIRKAFKKLAVSMHPDKNKDDKDAHDKFVKIARAYETLKDPDLRKHYDLYGEDNQNKNHQSYQSWSYYRDNFGIYDDDPEIVTLTRAEFEQSVENGEDIWFINFYSAMCSHCHQLAPTWRKFAQRMQGVIRVGAVNCEDDWVLCRNQFIQSYPSLVYYPNGEKFRGDRSEDGLVEYVLSRLDVEVREVSPSTWPSYENEPRLLFFSDFSGDGPSEETRIKVAAMLDGLMMVSHVDCEKFENFCEKMGASSGTAVWPTKSDLNPVFLPGLEAQEILNQVLSQLPEPALISLQDFEELRGRLEEGASEPWLLYFHIGEMESARLDLRKFPAKLPGMRIGRVNCGQSHHLCSNLHIHRYPVYGIFKQGGSYELYHGRSSASDVAQFARQSSKAQYVTTLTPDEFGASAPLSSTPMLVDFFAPWCPPCMRLLPELRQASQILGPTVPVGTVDCTVHAGLCRQMGVNSYPTTRLYNGSRVDHFSGEHKANSIVEFLQDLMSPVVQELDSETFYETLGKKNEGEMWLVDYFAPWCGPCQQLAPQWRKLAKMLSDLTMIKIASVNCEKHSDLCSQHGIRSYPSIRLYPLGSRGLSQVALYSGYHRDAHTLRQWVMDFVPSIVEDLDERSFNKIVRGSSKPWVIDFYAPWCGHCTVFAPEFDLAARKLETTGVSSGKVDCQDHQPFCQHLGVRAYPTVRLFLPDERGDGIELSSRSADDLVQVVKSMWTSGTQNQHDEL